MESQGRFEERVPITQMCIPLKPVFSRHEGDGVQIMDEPSTALDLYSKENIRGWIKKYCEMDGIVVMTTHDEKEILSSDRCLLMNEGGLRELTKEEMDIDYIKGMLA